MKRLKIGYGIILIVIAIISILAYQYDYHTGIFQIINILIVFGWGIWFLFLNKKKDVDIKGDKLIVSFGDKKLKEIDLSKKPMISKGIRSINFVFQDFTEKLIYSQFDSDSVQKLKSLT